jgi:hypothetical protein
MPSNSSKLKVVRGRAGHVDLHGPGAPCNSAFAQNVAAIRVVELHGKWEQFPA